MTATSTRSSATKKSTKNARVPRLRFPEFGAQINYSKLGNLGSFIGGGTPSTHIAEYWSGTIPWISSSDVSIDDIFGLNITRKITTSAISSSATKIVPKGSVLIVSRVGVGKVVIAPTSLCTSQDFINFVPTTIDNRFTAYFLLSKRSILISITQGTSISGFSKSDLELIKIPVPSLPEQQKIADCLSSLDDLITAESAKLEALKEHKKGLMQQLFPREGETTPRLRFPEFEGSGEWEVKQLGDIVKFQSGSTPSKANDTFWDGTIPWASAKDMKSFYLEDTLDHITEVAVKSGAKLAPTKSILMLTRGMTLLRDIPICFLTKTMSFNQDVKALHVRKDKDPAFIAFLLLSMKPVILSIVTIAGHGTGRLDTDQLKALPLCIPTLPEQQKIASVLSSLDDRITAQAEQIETLQAHKKGLMQQLFPVMEG